MKLKIQKWGNSAAIRLPAALLAQLGVSPGASLEGEFRGNQLVLKAPAAAQGDAVLAAMKFAIRADEGMAFLQCWLHGDFDAIRKEWPEAPEAVFIGADPLYKPAPVQSRAV
jgi:antitoxin component of MazEF toxin-antitoxin module